MGLERLSFSLETPLRRQLDRLVRRSNYTNRSEFIRDLVRKELVQAEWQADRQTLGTLTLVYDHHRMNLERKLTAFQHEHYASVLATLHVHLDRHLCAEVLLLRGRAAQLRRFADTLKQHRGVLHGELSMSTLGKKLS